MSPAPHTEHCREDHGLFDLGASDKCCFDQRNQQRFTDSAQYSQTASTILTDSASTGDPCDGAESRRPWTLCKRPVPSTTRRSTRGRELQRTDRRHAARDNVNGRIPNSERQQRPIHACSHAPECPSYPQPCATCCTRGRPQPPSVRCCHPRGLSYPPAARRPPAS